MFEKSLYSKISTFRMKSDVMQFFFSSSSEKEEEYYFIKMSVFLQKTLMPFGTPVAGKNQGKINKLT